jgi:hypothetical protein
MIGFLRRSCELAFVSSLAFVGILDVNVGVLSCKYLCFFIPQGDNLTSSVGTNNECEQEREKKVLFAGSPDEQLAL